MAYSINVQNSCILEVNSGKPNDFFDRKETNKKNKEREWKQKGIYASKSSVTYKQTRNQEEIILWQQRRPRRKKNIVSGYNAKSIRKEHINVFITERFIEKTVFFWNSIKKFRMSHQRCSTKKLFLKLPQYSQKITCAGVSFHLC